MQRPRTRARHGFFIACASVLLAIGLIPAQAQGRGGHRWGGGGYGWHGGGRDWHGGHDRFRVSLGFGLGLGALGFYSYPYYGYYDYWPYSYPSYSYNYSYAVPTVVTVPSNAIPTSSVPADPPPPIAQPNQSTIISPSASGSGAETSMSSANRLFGR